MPRIAGSRSSLSRVVLFSTAAAFLIGMGVVAPKGALAISKSFAAASGPRVCHQLEDGFEKDDGSVLAAGPECLVSLDASGDLQPGFGDGGVSPINLVEGQDGTRFIELVHAPQGSLVLTDGAFIRFGEDGKRLASFGDDGRVMVESRIADNNGLMAVAVGEDGGVFFSGVKASVGGYVAKLTPTGELDHAFSDDGVYWPSQGGPYRFTALRVDPAGRLLAAGDFNAGVGVRRFLPGGTVDPTFGDAGLASAPPCVGECETNFQEISLVDGGITLLGLGQDTDFTDKLDQSGPYWARFGADGDYISSYSRSDRSPGLTDTLPDGDFATAKGFGGRINEDGSGGFLGGIADRSLELSPGGGGAFTATYNPVTGNLLAPGFLSGADDYYGAIVKRDATTGKPDPDFGINGVAFPWGNDCPYGFSNVPSIRAPWKRCRIKAPDIDLTIKFGKVKSRYPSLRAKLEILNPAVRPLFLSQRMTVRLPDRLRFKAGKLKSHLFVRPNTVSLGHFETHLRGKVITVKFTPDIISTDPAYNPDPLPFNATVKIAVGVKRGGLRAIPKKRRHQKLNFVTRADSFGETQSFEDWWEGRSTRRVFRAAPAGRFK